ncbi:hypothetical protein [Dyadobacter sp. 32]|uniref:hypothetical protein n=1 Tax=Dyadobacter sp. 32 TaxID=538966 RepID=UPI0011EEF966
MSAIIGILYDQMVKIGADTYAHQPFQVGDKLARHHNFSSKVFLLPHIRSAFACTGMQRFGNLFYEFVQTAVVGKDINCILNLDMTLFDGFVKTRESQLVYGHIYAYGFDFIRGKFRGAYLFYGEGFDGNWLPLTSNSDVDHPRYVVVPAVEDFIEKLDQKYPDESLSVDAFIVAGIQLQRQEDLARELSAQVGIGGEIILTTLGFNGENNFTIISEVVYEFPDKDEIGEMMLTPSTE